MLEIRHTVLGEEQPALLLGAALAASAALPGLLGPFVRDAIAHSWFNHTDRLSGVEEQMAPDAHSARKAEVTEPVYSDVHLWDGGAHDNLGLEGLHNLEEALRNGIDFCVRIDYIESELEHRSTKPLVAPSSIEAGTKVAVRPDGGQRRTNATCPEGASLTTRITPELGCQPSGRQSQPPSLEVFFCRQVKRPQKCARR